jgi:alpha-L-fucosidase
MDNTQRIRGWQDLEFGLFIHFGLYSLLGGVYNGKIIRRGYSEQILSHGYLSQADYERLTTEFALPAFDADAIVRTAKQAGMRYVVITTKHHDGFCLFDTETTDYKSTNSACKIDIVKTLSEACRRAGLAFGLYFSWIDWHFPHALPISSHNSDAIPPLHHALNIAQLTELLTNYGPISELWMDMGAPTPEQSREVKALARTLQPQCMINGRIWNDEQDFLTMGDNQLPTVPLNCPWQTPASMYKETWGYRSWQERGDLKEKINELTATARTVVAEGGNYLLNIGLMGDGAIQGFEEQVLLGIGEQLKREPLQRRGHQALQPLPFQKKQLTLDKPEVLHRYTGSEYYSYRPIATTLLFTLIVEEEARVRIEWKTKAPLATQQKICFHIDGDIYYASLQQGRSGDPLISGYPLHKGIHTITIHTVGEPLMREALVDEHLSLILTKE